MWYNRFVHRKLFIFLSTLMILMSDIKSVITFATDINFFNSIMIFGEIENINCFYKPSKWLIYVGPYLIVYQLDKFKVNSIKMFKRNFKVLHYALINVT